MQLKIMALTTILIGVANLALLDFGPPPQELINEKPMILIAWTVFIVWLPLSGLQKILILLGREVERISLVTCSLLILFFLIVFFGIPPDPTKTEVGLAEIIFALLVYFWGLIDFHVMKRRNQ